MRRTSPLLQRIIAVPVAVLAASVLVACGGGDTVTATEGGLERLDAVTISGDVGSAPKVEWKDRMTAGEAEAETLVTGEGPELAEGDSVLAHMWIGNGFSQQQVHNGYESAAEVLTLDQNLPPYLESLKGATVGSRIAVTVRADEAFGEAGNPTLGVGSRDPMLVIADVASKVLPGPDGAEKPKPEWAPKPVVDAAAKNTVTGLDTAGTPEPGKELQTAVLIEGTGPAVEKGQTIAVRYLGRTRAKAEPFDQNFGAAPTAFAIGEGAVVKGWDQGLVGKKVGSRVVLSVPPALGYGEAGQGEAIPPNSHLYFVVDILGAV